MELRGKSDLPLPAIAALCQKYNVQELSVFGSLLRPDFRPDSDVDFLVVFANADYGAWLSKLSALEEELASLLHRHVDLISKRGVEQSRNAARRKRILELSEVIYAAR